MHFSFFANKRVHLGVCGSIAAYKAITLARMLQKSGIHVSATLTDAACEFIRPLTFEALGVAPVYTTMFHDTQYGAFGHLEPGQNADLLCIVPASANTLAKIAAGIADTQLTAQAVAFAGPLLFAPAMNPKMWAHSATQSNIQTLVSRGGMLVTPDCGQVACGDTGEGKLPSLETLFFAICHALAPKDMADKHVLVTLGPTREPWDGVRFWSNPSTGQMGSALAVAAWLRGATVTAIAGPGVPPLPAGITMQHVTTAQQMADAAQSLWNRTDYGLFTAAVADFSPQPYGKEKFKKSGAEEGFTITFSPNTDILATLGSCQAPHQRILGFAAETSHIAEQTKAKLHRKKAHLMAGNPIGLAEAGFGAATNTLFVVDHTGKEEQWENMPKPDVAWRLLNWLLTL